MLLLFHYSFLIIWYYISINTSSHNFVRIALRLWQSIHLISVVFNYITWSPAGRKNNTANVYLKTFNKVSVIPTDCEEVTHWRAVAIIFKVVSLYVTFVNFRNSSSIITVILMHKRKYVVKLFRRNSMH